MASLSNDELRAKTRELEERILAFIKTEQDAIADLRKKLDEDIDVDAREEVYNEIDAIEKQIDDKIEEVLDQILPEAFASGFRGPGSLKLCSFFSGTVEIPEDFHPFLVMRLPLL